MIIWSNLQLGQYRNQFQVTWMIFLFRIEFPMKNKLSARKLKRQCSCFKEGEKCNSRCLWGLLRTCISNFLSKFLPNIDTCPRNHAILKFSNFIDILIQSMNGGSQWILNSRSNWILNNYHHLSKLCKKPRMIIKEGFKNKRLHNSTPCV